MRAKDVEREHQSREEDERVNDMFGEGLGRNLNVTPALKLAEQRAAELKINKFPLLQSVDQVVVNKFIGEFEAHEEILKPIGVAQAELYRSIDYQIGERLKFMGIDISNRESFFTELLKFKSQELERRKKNNLKSINKRNIPSSMWEHLRAAESMFEGMKMDSYNNELFTRSVISQLLVSS